MPLLHFSIKYTLEGFFKKIRNKDKYNEKMSPFFGAMVFPERTRKIEKNPRGAVIEEKNNVLDGKIGR